MIITLLIKIESLNNNNNNLDLKKNNLDGLQS